MLNLKVMLIIGLLFIGLTATTAEEIEKERNEETLSILPLESKSLSSTTIPSISPSDVSNSSSQPTTSHVDDERTSSNTSNTTRQEIHSDEKSATTMNSLQMNSQPMSVPIDNIFNENDDDRLMNTNKHVRVHNGEKQIDENDDSSVPLVAMTKQHAEGRALNLTGASLINEMANRKAVEMINFVTTQSSAIARAKEDLSDVSMDDDEEDSMHDMHVLNEDTEVDVNECINNERRYK
ncbi:hypothetical protein Bhyg_17040, partial [Pseudolycoriella hygida]